MEPADPAPTSLRPCAGEPLLAGGGDAVAALASALERARAARRVRIDGPRGAGHRRAATLASPEHAPAPRELWADRPGALEALRTLGPDHTVCLRRVDRLPADAQAELARALSSGAALPRLLTTVERDPASGPGAGGGRTDRPTRTTAPGTLDPDLDYLLGGRTVALPALAERRGHMELLCAAAIARAAADLGRAPLPLSTAALAHLRVRPWPGELEELELTLRLALLRAEGGCIHVDDLGGAPAPALPSPLGRTLAEVERAHLEAVLEAVGGNRARAARELGINRSTLYNKLRARDAS